MCGSIFASKKITGIVPVTGTVKLPVMLQCESEGQSTGILSRQACHGVDEEGEEGGRTIGRFDGGGAPKVSDLRLLEDGSERGGALDSDLVTTETVSEECMGWGW